ncbi:unnamed protein product [Dimorphilus gyrociliatus]|uniref:Beta-lactamase-related domain-containing protein n=1 Tax=Dimorphilus gyrociliatus TaxID=2664684 RepID=A0A7I8VMT5_9ANNE|nr:unnamed protein product [Dimorphilus gyrociliatus]
MGFVKPVLLAIIAIGVYNYYTKEKPAPVTSVKMRIEKGWEQVGEKFKELVLAGEIKGSSFSVRHKGKEVVNIVGGYADKDSLLEWDFDTLSLLFSSTKMYGATIILHMVERKQLSLDDTVSKYWPEFAKNGKKDITIGDILTHRSCLFLVDQNYDPEDLIVNPKAVEKIFEDQEPSCRIGKDHAYHAFTYGALLHLIVRRVDNKGRGLSQYFREEIGIPHNLDTFIGLPYEENYRTTRMERIPILSSELLRSDAHVYRELSFGLLLNPNSPLAKSVKYPSMYLEDYSVNNPNKRRAPDACCLGFSTTSSMTKFFSLLEAGKILKNETLDLITTPVSDGENILVKVKIFFSHGFFITNLSGKKVYGHSGAGGQSLFSDKENELVFAYLTNYATIYSRGDDPRFIQLFNAAYECLKNVTK